MLEPRRTASGVGGGWHWAMGEARVETGEEARVMTVGRTSGGGTTRHGVDDSYRVWMKETRGSEGSRLHTFCNGPTCQCGFVDAGKLFYYPSFLAHWV